MDIEAIARNVANTITGATFLWTVPHEANRVLGNQDPGQKILMYPPEATIKFQRTGTQEEYWICKFSFLINAESDAGGDYDPDKMNRLKGQYTVCSQFMSKLAAAVQPTGKKPIEGYEMHSPDPEDPSDIHAYFDWFDSNYEGVGATIVIPAVGTPEECFVGSGKFTLP
jgi:hypothetical protein